MTRRAYLNERQAVYRWRAQLEQHLAKIEQLLARRPQGRDAQYGKLPPLPDAIFDHWGMTDVDQSV